uniref:COMM domain-containing protein 1 n=1 Tax=Poecilia formosa TaxID=48698 RepID=A0A096MIM5_POEFO
KSIATADMDHAQLEAFLTAQTKRHGGGGLSAEQAAALSRFWKSQRVRVRESLLAQHRWEPTLRGLSWRVDLQTGDSHGNADHRGPVALMELELGRAGQAQNLTIYFVQNLNSRCLHCFMSGSVQLQGLFRVKH